MTPTTWAGNPTKTNWPPSSNNHDRVQPVLLLVKGLLRGIQCPDHVRLLRIGELAARGHLTGELADADEGPRDLAPPRVGIGMAGDEELLIQRQGRRVAQHVERFENLGRQEAAE